MTVLVAVALLISVTFASFSGATAALSASVVNFCSSSSLGVAVQNNGSSPGAVDVTINGTTSNLQVAPGTTQRALVAAVEDHTYTMTATVVSGPVLLDTTVVRDCEGGDGGDDGGTDDSGADSTDGDNATDSTDDGTTTTAPTTTMPSDDGGDDTGADDDTATDSTDDGTTTTAPSTTAPTTTMPTDDGGSDDGSDGTTTVPTTTMPTNGDDGSTTVPANGDTNENGDLPETGPAVLYVQLLSGLLVLCVGMVLADIGRKRSWL